MATIQGIYIALFGRPADPVGLEYFNGITQHGADLAAIADLSGQPEYLDHFKGMTNDEIVRSIYNNLFARDAEQAGLDFFVQRLTDGRLNVNNIAIAILDGAREGDLATVEAKTAYANIFTRQIDSVKGNAAYVGGHATEEIRHYLAGVTADRPGTMTDIGTAVIHLIGEDTDTSGGSTPISHDFLLTLADDNIIGTSADDIIRGTVSATSNLSTYVSADIIDGGAGKDTLILSISATTTMNSTNVTNIEALQVTSAASSRVVLTVPNMHLTDLIHDGSAAGASVLLASNEIPANLIVRNTVAETIFALSDLSGGADHVSLTLDHAGSAGQRAMIALLATANGTANQYESLSIASAGTENFAEIGLDQVQRSLAHIDITGSANTNLTFSGGSAAAFAIDASAATGAVTLGSSAQTLNLSTMSAVLGSSDDRIYVDNSGLPNGTSIDAGAGHDTLEIVVLSNTVTVEGIVARTSNFEAMNLDLRSGAGASFRVDAANLAGISDVTVTNSATQLQVVNWSAATFDASGVTSAVSLTSNALQTTIKTGSAADTIILGTGAETVDAGAGDDKVTIGTDTNGTSGADRITLGDGADTVLFMGSVRTGTGGSAGYNGFTHIEDFSLATDHLQFSANDNDFGLRTGTNRAVSGIAKGTNAGGYNTGDALQLQSIVKNAASAAAVQDVSVFKLTTETPFASDVKTTFAQAMGTARVTGLANESNYIVSLYDPGSHEVVIAVVNTGGDGQGTSLAATDFIGGSMAVVGVLENISSADYAAFAIII